MTAIEPTQLQATLNVAVVLSMLSEGPADNSATRVFDGAMVLARTVARLAGQGRAAATVVIAWGDQLAAVASVVPDVTAHSMGIRRPSAALLETEAALRWADGWRGALLGRTSFDRGFDAAAITSALDTAGCDAALLMDPAAALIDGDVVARLIDRLETSPDQAYAFTPGAVGTGGILLRRDALDELARAGRGPGSLLTYHPDRVAHDPIAKSFAAPTPPRIARSSTQLSVDSRRQVTRLSQLADRSASEVIDVLAESAPRDALPREVVVEVTCRRATRPEWSISPAVGPARADMALAAARDVFAQLAAADDLRLTLAGVGDPLLHPQIDEIIRAAGDAGIAAIHVETDFLPEDAAAIKRLAEGPVDVVSVRLPAVHATTYARVMGVDRMREALDNVRSFLLARAGRVPILAPTFIKCQSNVGEMELWYDQWIRAVGAAVIRGPSDLSGRVAYAGVADMTPSVRRPCRRLRSRLTILSDGTVASCEEDVYGEQACGRADDVAAAWRDGAELLRSLHANRRWDESALCRACRMWDRP